MEIPSTEEEKKDLCKRLSKYNISIMQYILSHSLPMKRLSDDMIESPPAKVNRISSKE